MKKSSYKDQLKQAAVQEAEQKKALQDKVRKIAREAAEHAKDAVIDEFNNKKQYFVLSEAGKTVIYRPYFSESDNGTAYTRYSFEDFRKLYQNQKIEFWRPNEDEPVYKSKANVWLDDPARKTYIGGVTFNPNPDYVADPDVLNLWKGFRVDPIQGDWSLLKNHVFKVICGGNKGYNNYLLNWTALMFQRPWERGLVAVVCCAATRVPVKAFSPRR
jgi:hypothetical protein